MYNCHSVIIVHLPLFEEMVSLDKIARPFLYNHIIFDNIQLQKPHLQQARKALRCDSYLQSETITHSPTDWPTDRGGC